MIRLSWMVVFIGSILKASCTHAMDIKCFDRVSALKRPAQAAYQELGRQDDSELVAKFKYCCSNGNALDSAIENALQEVVRNKAGKETVKMITAKLYPFVRCANTLQALVDSISVDEEKDESAAKRKAKGLVLLFGTLTKGKRKKSVSETIRGVKVYLDDLSVEPADFPDPSTPYSPGSLLGTFDDGLESTAGKVQRQREVVDQLNRSWNHFGKKVVLDAVSCLRMGTFSLERGAQTEYEYNTKDHRGIIRFSGKEITAKCIRGPLLCERIDTLLIEKCYLLEDRDISASSGFHHELFHHLVIGLELDEFASFERLARFLVMNGVDALYVLSLKDIFTDMDEFRNIIGLFLDSKGNPLFDECSEASYLTSAGKYIRSTHKSNAGSIKYVPIGFVDLIKRANGSLMLRSKPSVDDNNHRITWC